MADSNRTLTTIRRRRPPKPKLAESKVLERKDITHDLLLMWIEKPEGFSFKAGQYCTIGREGIERAYSIVSAPHEETLELFVELVPLPDGVLTPLLWELGPGDVLSIRPRAKGIFTFKPKYVNHLLVATVTGVVPYISYLRDYLHRGRQRPQVLRPHGGQLRGRVRLRRGARASSLPSTQTFSRSYPPSAGRTRSATRSGPARRAG